MSLGNSMPPKKAQKLKVVKIPLDYIPEDIPAKFPPMNILYLELLENKEKIKPELRNKDYVSKKSSDHVPPELLVEPLTEIHFSDDVKSSEKKKKDMKTSPRTIKKLLDLTNFKEEDIEKKDSKYDKYKKDMEDRDRDQRESERRQREKEEYNSKERNEYEKDVDHKSSRDSHKSRSSHSSRSPHRSRRDSRRSKRESKRDSKRDSHRRHRSRDRRSRRHRHSSPIEEERKEKKSESSRTLEDILKGRGSSERKHEERKDRYEESDKQKEKLSDIKEEVRRTGPPKLSEIVNGEVNQSTYKTPGGTVVRDITKGILTSEEEESNKKRDLIFRFDILRRSYKGAAIPDYSEYTPLETLQKSYDDTVRRLSLDSTVEGYKKYLIMGFMGAEFILGSWFKFDMKDFTQQQLVSMNSYERLLIELGEKSYLSGPSSWPVEIRLLGLILVNAAVFIATKMIFKATGTNFSNMLNVNTGPSTTTMHPQKAKRKMKGPNIDMSDLSGPDTITSTSSESTQSRDGSLDYTKFQSQTTSSATAATTPTPSKPIQVTKTTTTTTKTATVAAK